MTDKRQVISSGQMMIFILATQIGIGIITMPSELAKEAGHDAWIPILLSGFLAIFIGILIVVLLKRYGNQSIYDIHVLLFGKFTGLIFNIAIVIYLMLAASLGIRLFGEFVRLTLLPDTPPLILTAFVLLPSIYLTWYGLKPMCRFHSFVPVVAGIIVLYILLIYNQMNFSFLLPVGEVGFTNIVRSSRSAFFGYIGVELIAVIYPNISDKKNVLKHHISASVISMVFFLIVTVACISVFGEIMLKGQTIPLFSLTRIFHAPILERVDLYFIALWFIPIASSLRGYLYSAYYSANKIFHLPKSKGLFGIFLIILYWISRIPKDINAVFQFAQVINYTGLGVIGLFMVCLLFSFFKKRGVHVQ